MFNEDEMQEILTLVAETLYTDELEQINKFGLAKFNELKIMERKYLEAKFKKAKTRRNIDWYGKTFDSAGNHKSGHWDPLLRVCRFRRMDYRQNAA